jgi:colanic acid biosynthesis glycosyl transferase WcaI
MKKKVLLLSQFFPPETYAGANRVGPMAEVLSKYYEVCVLTLKPSYPSPRAYEGISLELHDANLPYAVKRTFDFPPHQGAFSLRAVREQTMAIRMALRALPESVDLLVVSTPSMFLGPVGLAVARAQRAKFVWDVRDITWGYAKDTAGKSPVMAIAASALETYMLYTLRRADLVVGASRGISRALVEAGAAYDKTVTIPNGISASLLETIAQQTAEKKVEKSRPIVAYAGLIGYNQGLGILVEAARTLPDVEFALAGDGPELPLLKKKARELGVGNVTFRGYLSREGLLELYRESDILIAHVRSTPTTDATMVPIKLFEYMATGRPIVYAGRGVAADLLRQIGCAVTVPPGEPESISTAITTLLQEPEQGRILGLRGQACVRANFVREKLLEELAHTLKERFG